MFDGFPAGPPLFGGALLTFVVERGLRPAPLLFSRPLRAYAAHLGVWTLAFALVLGVTQRPWFAALLVLAEMVFIVLISNAKTRTLREPFVFQDFEYFIDALKFPRLFLPYFGRWPVLVTLVLFAAVFYPGMVLEQSIPARIGYTGFFAGVAGLLAAGCLMLWLATPRRLPVTFDATDDLRRFGLPACLWYYAVAERKDMQGPVGQPFAAPRKSPPPARRGHVVVVQSESFFDARRLHAGIHPDVYANFDAACAAATDYGTLVVPAWGANTVRTEFSFLTGIDPLRLGIHRFNPYRRYARRRLPALAGHFKRAGYRTVCLHPFPEGYYARDIVFPLLDIDEFVDLREFGNAERSGAYVSDAALAEKVRALLDASIDPVFAFVITMENHGPLHMENPVTDDVARLYALQPTAGFDELTVYLRHLANADRMIGTLTAGLQQSPRDGVLCWYGDHVPILQQVYAATGFADARTDYFIWRKGAVPQFATQAARRIEDLGGLLLDRAGFERLLKYHN